MQSKSPDLSAAKVKIPREALCGRPRALVLTQRELARNRKRRQRAKLAKNSLTKVEIFLPDALKKEIHKLAGNRSFSAVGLEAFRF